MKDKLETLEDKIHEARVSRDRANKRIKDVFDKKVRRISMEYYEIVVYGKYRVRIYG